ncbi:MAG TPA: tetratricopeptide repeat protein, partial [Phycisphaerae bacterium]|nr:tetratricopeptide repeat protein [Phycisphaerae bacterium]
AMNNVGVIYQNGLGVGQDYQQAFTWYQKAADAGNVAAMNNLANLYANGLGVKQDSPKANEWWQKAAEAGDVDAMYYTHSVSNSVRDALHNGALGNPSQTFSICAQAAADGNVDAMNTLGVLYASGQGVTQDYQEALKWWNKAAMAGSGDAMFNVGMLYEHGLGVRQDYFKAHIWIEEAAPKGNQKAKDYLSVGRE